MPHAAPAIEPAVLPANPTEDADRPSPWPIRNRPEDSGEARLVEEIALTAREIARARERVEQIRAYQARRARDAWQLDRQFLAEKIGGQLARNPGHAVARLCRFRQGCEWLIGRWRLLGQVLESPGGAWNTRQRKLACRLLGWPPEFCDGEPWSASGTPEALVAAEIARLEDLLRTSLDALDAEEQALAVLGLPPEPSPELNRANRELDAWMRRHAWLCQRLDRERPKTRSSKTANPKPRPEPVETPPAAPPRPHFPAPPQLGARLDEIDHTPMAPAMRHGQGVPLVSSPR